jgi:hypothetical protein
MFVDNILRSCVFQIIIFFFVKKNICYFYHINMATIFVYAYQEDTFIIKNSKRSNIFEL